MIRPVQVGSTFERGLRTYLQLRQAPTWRRYAHRLPIKWRRRLVNADRSLRHTDPVKLTHYEFASTTNQRGAETLALIESRRRVADAAVLDIGCAYGGFLVAALHRGARRAVGLDINPKLVDLARTNLRDYDLLARAELILGDATDAAVAGRLGSFDVVICNDVIEHVADPDLLAERIVSLLAADGSVAFLEIPNLRSSRYLASDGHFQLFGITALEHHDAEAYFHGFYPGVGYTVSHLYELERYRRMFESRGCQVELEPYPRAPTSFEICQDDYAAFEARLRDFAPHQVPARLVDTLRTRARAFVDDARADAARVTAGALPETEFLTRHYDPFWRLFVRKHGGHSAAG